MTRQVMPKSIEVVHPGVMALGGMMSAIAAVGGETDPPFPSPRIWVRPWLLCNVRASRLGDTAAIFTISLELELAGQ